MFVTAVLLGVVIAIAAEANTPTNFAVTPNGITSFIIDGNSNPTLTLTRGFTYNFNVNTPGHPFDIKTARVTGTGSRFATGVTGQGTTVGTVTFVVPPTAPATLFYQCEVHSSMGGTLNIVDRGVPGVMPAGLGLLAIAIGTLGARALRRRPA
jgi:hypothetical protein